MEYIEKTFPKSDFEKNAIHVNSSVEKMVNLPVSILKWGIMKNIEAWRHPTDIPKPIIPICENELTVTRKEIPGKPSPVSITTYSSEGDVEGKRPLFLYIHGGGFIGGNSSHFEPLLRIMTDRLGVISATVDYNLSPEAKWPQALNDCENAPRHMIKNHSVDESRIFIAGDSSGGNLTAVLTLKLIQDGGHPVPKGQILLYPTVDLYNLKRDSLKQKGLAYYGVQKLMKVARQLYLANHADRRNVLVSPILSKFTAAQPDALSLIAECDGLRDEGIAYARLLGDAGGHSRCVLYKGTSHAFIENIGRSDTSDNAANEIVRFVEERI